MTKPKPKKEIEPTKRKPDKAKDVELEDDAWERFEKAVSEVMPPKDKRESSKPDSRPVSDEE